MMADALEDNAFVLCPRILCCRLVQIVLCADSPSSDTLKLYCWDDPTPRTSCYNPDPSACQFSYSFALTPVVTSTSPLSGIAGDVLTIRGSALDDITAVWLRQSWGTLACVIRNQTSTTITCTIPEMPAGRYTVSIICVVAWAGSAGHTGGVLLGLAQLGGLFNGQRSGLQPHYVRAHDSCAAYIWLTSCLLNTCRSRCKKAMESWVWMWFHMRQPAFHTALSSQVFSRMQGQSRVVSCCRL